jgi:hypothetical protein
MRDTQAFAWLHALKTPLSTDMYRLISSCARNIITSHTRNCNHIAFTPFLLYRGITFVKNLMPPSTPLSLSKTAALSRILDSVPKGYCRYMSGTVKVAKAVALANKFHTLYGIACSPAQRLARKSKGIANALLVLYWPEGVDDVHWLLLATHGTGLESERLQLFDEKPRLNWLGYELVRHSTHGRASWTWRRPREEMAELHELLAYQGNCKHYKAIEETLERIARQPGFNGVRTQSWSLFTEARRRGYNGPLPHLFFLQKVSHGERLMLNG